jgi:hypothetical protein
MTLAKLRHGQHSGGLPCCVAVDFELGVQMLHDVKSATVRRRDVPSLDKKWHREVMVL